VLRREASARGVEAPIVLELRRHEQRCETRRRRRSGPLTIEAFDSPACRLQRPASETWVGMSLVWRKPAVLMTPEALTSTRLD
jgi:hypothetical protein